MLVMKPAPTTMENIACLLFLTVVGLSSGCNQLRIRDWDLNDIHLTYEIDTGSLVALICDGTCQGPGYTPSLKWIRPGGRNVETFPGRLMSVFQESRRQIKLYLQDFQPADQGIYTCQGWVNGKWRTTSVFLKTAEHILIPDNLAEEETVVTASLPDTYDNIQPLPQPNIII